MVDLWGPLAFGSLNSAASRPAYTPSNGGADPETFFKDCSSPSAADGTEWRSAGLNMLLVQMRSAARKSGVAVSNLDDNLLTRAIRKGYGYIAAPGGTANALTATFDPPFLSASEMTGALLWLKIVSTNTSATVNLTVDALAAYPVKRLGAAALQIGDLQAPGIYGLAFDGTQFQIVAGGGLALPIGGSTLKAPKLVGIMATALAAGTSIPNATTTTVNYGTTKKNNLGTSTWNGNTLTVGAGEAGLWQVTANVEYGAGAGSSFVALGLTTTSGVGSYSASSSGTGGDGQAVSVPGIVPLAVGETVKAQTFHQLGGTASTLARDTSQFSAFLISSY
ncbi:hypothetical protein LJR009_001586 [Bosea sp. LjRoot9]|uniref:hypothetical protein n=1 Tax=Bosea sp. LjRoot9 TaxID=3342341 RepID=UPI003ED068EE